ncbi:hypothetical protein [Anaerovibrio lipolyticus]|uniref:hypothetical protein n=1 Tax=Anaerovibrio lipolyticus TaxID=82374 RepID=UPI0025E1E122|nr:hypothetical protein [Anaerovibrio lipolyticus]
MDRKEQKKFKRSNRPISEVIESCRQSFIKANGRLLTEEEAIKFVDEIRKDLRKKGKL